MVKRNLFIAIAGICTLLLTSCHVARYFYWNFADIHDNHKFSSVPVLSGGNPFSFKEATVKTEITLPANTQFSKAGQNMEQYLAENQTVAFLIIRRDTIIYEKYFDGYNNESIIPSFSVVKSFVSALVGFAVNEGYIKSIEQPVTDYLPDMKDPGFQKVRIVDLLNMRAGIDFTEDYSSPFGLMPKFYYGTNLKRYARNLRIKEPADLHYDYQSANTLLLSEILEKATGVPVDFYLQQKIWQPLGMESDASWSIDSKKHKNVKSFCCLNARTHDFARFGRLYLKDGNWNGKQLLPKQWIKQTLTITNDSRDSGGYPYHYHWRVTPEGEMFAKGVLGQYIYLDTSKEIIIVRLGKATGKANWPFLFKNIITKL